jgi:CheY-like chemotaxis protein
MKAADLLPRIILCADDDPDDRELLCFTMTKLDPSIEIISAENGIEVLTKLEALKAANNLPCLIVLDMNMPKMDGPATLVELKNDKDIKDIPIIFYTTSAKDRYRDLIEKYNVEIITKPSTMDVIEKEVSRLLSLCN